MSYPSPIVGIMTTKRNHNAESDLLTPGEAAKRIGVEVRSIARMADRGEIRSVRLPSGHRRYNAADVEALASGARSRRAVEGGVAS